MTPHYLKSDCKCMKERGFPGEDIADRDADFFIYTSWFEICMENSFPVWHEMNELSWVPHPYVRFMNNESFRFAEGNWR